MADPGALPRHFLHPCTLFAHREAHLVTTVLGSCVAVCLWDARRGVGGMNHYMLPLWNGEGLATPRYGNIAIPRLLEKLQALGSRKEDVVAKVFGGANVLAAAQGIFLIGDRNAALAKEQLAQLGIPIAASQTGGNQGQKILFNTGTGVVLMARIGAEG